MSDHSSDKSSSNEDLLVSESYENINSYEYKKKDSLEGENYFINTNNEEEEESKELIKLVSVKSNSRSTRTDSLQKDLVEELARDKD